jgi:hypothetical protein
MTATAYDRAYHKRWKYDRAHGVLRLVDATPARNHIATLEGAGWSLRAIAAAAAVSVQAVCHIRDGQTKANRRTSAAILRVPVDQLPTRSLEGFDPFVSRVGTVRRIQALMVIGWSVKAMGEHLTNGHDERWLYNKLNQQGRWVRRSTHDEVARLYRDLCTKPGPSDRARRWASEHGFAGPMDWDDIDHDVEPDRDLGTSQPVEYDDAVVRRLVDEGARVRVLTHDEAAAAYAELRRRGLSTFEIEHTYGLKSDRYREEEAS